MAIIANRVKTFSVIPDLLFTLNLLIRRFFAGGLILLSLLLWYLSFDSRISKVIFDVTASSIINPIVSIFDAIIEDISQFQSSIQHLWNAKQENIALKLENARLTRLLADTSYLHSENKHLKTHIKLSEDYLNDTTISGKIIGITNGIYKKTAIVNLGTKNGVGENQIAISDGNIVGRITQIADYNATIMLISDRGSRIPVITSKSGLRVIFAGNGENGGELLYVPEDSPISVGETLFSSGDGKYYPSGIPVARVIKKDGTRIYAEPIVSLSNIKFISIVNYKNN